MGTWSRYQAVWEQYRVVQCPPPCRYQFLVVVAGYLVLSSDPLVSEAARYLVPCLLYPAHPVLLTPACSGEL